MARTLSAPPLPKNPAMPHMVVGSLLLALFEGLAETLEAPAEGRVLDERLLADGELEAPPGSLEKEEPGVFVVDAGIPELALDDRAPEVESIPDLAGGGERLGAGLARLGEVGVEGDGLAGEEEGGEDAVVELGAGAGPARLDQGGLGGERGSSSCPDTARRLGGRGAGARRRPRRIGRGRSRRRDRGSRRRAEPRGTCRGRARAWRNGRNTARRRRGRSESFRRGRPRRGGSRGRGARCGGPGRG